MGGLLTDVNAWVTALLLAILMFGGWAAGWRRGRALRADASKAAPSKFNDAILTLLGLLLAFTFSMSLIKHEHRRQMAINDANAIENFVNCVGFLKQPWRDQLREVVRRYVEHRLAFTREPLAGVAMEQKLDEMQAMHGQMKALTREAVEAGTPVVVPLVNSLNALTSSHASRLAAVRDTLPASVVLLLFLAAILAMATMGWQQGAAGESRPLAMGGFAMLTSLVIWVTLDLNQPRKGWITVSQEPLERALGGMEKPASAEEKP